MQIQHQKSDYQKKKNFISENRENFNSDISKQDNLSYQNSEY